jgi:hypothetical protein
MTIISKMEVISNHKSTLMNQITRFSAFVALLAFGNALHGQCNPAVQFTISPPNVTTSSIHGQPGTLTEDFNSMATGNLPSNGTFTNGTFVKTGSAQVKPDDMWGGSGSQYLAISGSSGLVNLTLSSSARYVGFWWGAGDAANKLKMYGQCNGVEVKLAEFTTADVLNLLSASTVVANDGMTYASTAYRHANTGAEPFAFINVQLNDSNYYFTRIEVGGGGFELDNLTTSAVYGAGTGTVASAPTLISASAAGMQLSLNFQPPSFNGGSAIVNYDYSIDSGTTWISMAPADTSSPLTFNTIFGGLFQLQIRAVNGIGSGAGSNILAYQMGQPESVLQHLELVPNPASTHLRVRYSGPSTPVLRSLELVDATGKIIRSFEPKIEETHSLSGVPKGTYWLVIRTDGGLLKQPLVVQ